MDEIPSPEAFGKFADWVQNDSMCLEAFQTAMLDEESWAYGAGATLLVGGLCGLT